MPLTEPLRDKLLWLFLAVSAIAAIEPSPYEAMFFVCLIAFARGGLTFDVALAPLILCLFLFDAAAVVALIPYTHDPEAVSFTFITIYITMTTILFATLVAGRPLERMKVIRSGYVFAAVVAAVLGTLGYANVAGLSAYFTIYEGTRAAGPFKDANVYGPFMVAPIVWVCQDLLLGRAAPARSVALLLLLAVGLLLSFSRGAIIDTALALLLVLAFTYLTTGSPKLRRRTALVAAGCVVATAALIALAMTIPSVRDLALERATLVKDYDAGEQGRFGNQLRAIPLLLELPLGFGPFRFNKVFPIDPHEVFLSAFASFGWAGGVAFTAFVALTLYVGVVFTFRRSRVQTEFIGLFAAALPQLLQGVQIDTMHWRHLFMLFGLMFGLAAAAQREARAKAPLPAPGLATA